jgi:hypothetical protein
MGILRFIGIYVLGDAFILVPFLVIFLPIIYLIKGWWGVGVAWCVYMSVRNFIEIIYWLFQQFSDRSYRPGFPFKDYDNNKVYIVFQLLNTVHAVVYMVLLIFLLR